MKIIRPVSYTHLLAAAEFKYGTNMRGSAGYRQHLAKVLIKREIMSILSEEI